MMPLSSIPGALVRFVRARPLVAVLGLVVAVGLAVVVFTRTRHTAAPQNSYYVVKRGDFLVSIIEGGTLRAASEVIVRCELEGTPRIISIVPEGTAVKKGDLLVELDSSGIKEKISNQDVTVQGAEAAWLRAKEDLSIQKLTMDAAIKDAELKVEFAASDLEKYKEGDWPQQKQGIAARITLAEEDMQRAQDRLNWTVQLEKRGYATRDELKADQLTVKRQDITIAQAKEELRLADKYDYPKKVRLMESTVEQTKLELIRTRQRSAATITSFDVDVKTKFTTLETQRERWQQAKEQLVLAKIFAPQDGLVIYATGSSVASMLIEEGAVVRQRQDLIKLPDVTQMMVEVKVHESHVRQVKPGLNAFVTIDSLPDQRFAGVVKKVGVLPDSASRYYNPNLKVYSTEVWITEALNDIKPGVSGRAEVIVTNLLNVLTVPIQAVTTHKGRQVCFVEREHKTFPVPVEIGLYNEKMIEIKAGLQEGDRVLLAALSATDTIPMDGSTDKPEDSESKTNAPKSSESPTPATSHQRAPPAPKPPFTTPAKPVASDKSVTRAE